MKRDGIQRAVRANRHERSTGDAPSLGPVARMAGPGTPQGPRRRRRHEQSRHAERKVALNGSILTGMLALVVLIAAVVFWIKPQIGDDRHSSGKSSRVPRKEKIRVRSEFPSPSESEALSLVHHALETRDPGKVAEWFQFGTEDSGKVVDFLRNLPAAEGRVERCEWLGSVDANNLQLDGVAITFKSGEKLSERMAFLTPDEIGVWKIDFDGFARTVAPSWSDLMENGAEVGVVRVSLSEGNDFNGPFSDDKQWICYSLASEDWRETLIGYCKTDSPQARAIRSIYSRRPKVNRATLEIRRVEGASSRQFEIVKVLAEDWVRGKAPFDEGFK